MNNRVQGYYRYFPANISFFHSSQPFQSSSFQLFHSSRPTTKKKFTTHRSQQLFSQMYSPTRQTKFSVHTAQQLRLYDSDWTKKNIISFRWKEKTAAHNMSRLDFDLTTDGWAASNRMTAQAPDGSARIGSSGASSQKKEKKLPLVLQLLMRPKPSSQQYAGTQPFPVASIWKRSYSDNSRATAGNMHAHVTYAVAS